jgi:hypothetical protein
MTLSRRQALRWLTSAGTVAIVVACSPPAPATAPTVVSATPASAAKPIVAAGRQPKRGGTLRVGQIGDIARLDGQLVTTVDAT